MPAKKRGPQEAARSSDKSWADANEWPGSSSRVDPPANPPQEAAGSSDKPPKTAKEKRLSGGKFYNCGRGEKLTPHQELAAPINGDARICPTCEAIERISADPKLEYESTLATVKAERVTARFQKSRIRAGVWKEVVEETKQQQPGIPRKERTATMHDAFKLRVRASMERALRDGTASNTILSSGPDIREMVKADGKYIEAQAELESATERLDLLVVATFWLLSEEILSFVSCARHSVCKAWNIACCRLRDKIVRPMMGRQFSEKLFEQCVLDGPHIHFQRKLTRLLEIHGHVGVAMEEMTLFWYKAQLYFSLSTTASMQRYKEAPLYSMVVKRLLHCIGNGYCCKWLQSGLETTRDFRLHPTMFHDIGFLRCRDLGCSTLGASIAEVLLTLQLLAQGLEYCPGFCSCRDLEPSGDNTNTGV